jgi:hypothetical protein
MKSKFKMDKEVRNGTIEIFNGLVKLTNSPNFKYLGMLIRLMKQNILFDEFVYPENDPVKNSINKSFHKGGDWFLTVLANTCKNAGTYADELEEKHD